MRRDLDAEGEGWRSASPALAEWSSAHLVNRCDVWGGYWPRGVRETLGKIRTAPRVKERGLLFLTPEVLSRHFEGRDWGDVVGLHTTSADNTSRWLALDFDAHGDVTAAQRTRLRGAVDWCTEQLAERGAGVLLEDSDGAGGYHVWVRFDEPAPTPGVFAWLSDVVARCAAATDVRPECYPKQAHVGAGQFGNWLRLPGLHHTRPHWSRLARPGGEWLSGADAAACLLSWPATPAEIVPPLEAWPAAETFSPISPISPTPLPRVSVGAGGLRDRAALVAAYVRRLPHGEAGTARSDRLFSLCRFLQHGAQCTAAEAMPVIDAWNAGNRPPLPAAKVRETWANAGRYASRPVQLRAEGVRHAA